MPSSIVRSLVGHDDVLSFSMNGLSKAAGMPQMKLGWIVWGKWPSPGSRRRDYEIGVAARQLSFRRYTRAVRLA